MMVDYAIPLRNENTTRFAEIQARQKPPPVQMKMSLIEGDDDDLSDIDAYNRKKLSELQEEKVAAGDVDRRNHMLIEKILNEITGAGNVAHDNSHLTNRGDDTPVIKLDKRLFELKADRILPRHKLLRLLDPVSVKILLNHSLLLKVRDG